MVRKALGALLFLQSIISTTIGKASAQTDEFLHLGSPHVRASQAELVRIICRHGLTNAILLTRRCGRAILSGSTPDAAASVYRHT